MEFIKTHWFLLLLLGIASVLVFVWLFILNRNKLNAKWWELLIITVIHTTYGVFAVMLFAILESGFDFSKFGNISMFGGFFLMPVMYLVYAKIKKLPLSLVFDIFTIALAGTLLLARTNCLYVGCCQGIEIGNNGFKWPAREFDLAIHALFLIFALPWIYKERAKGLAYPLYLATYGLFRFLNEWFRESESTSPFHIGHIWAIISFVIGISLLIIIKIKLKKGAVNYETV